jgi:hypothetical protein
LSDTSAPSVDVPPPDDESGAPHRRNVCRSFKILTYDKVTKRLFFSSVFGVRGLLSDDSASFFPVTGSGSFAKRIDREACVFLGGGGLIRQNQLRAEAKPGGSPVGYKPTDSMPL